MTPVVLCLCVPGKDFDQQGERVSWWDSKVTDVFNKKAECFVDQYSQYSVGNSDQLKVLAINKINCNCVLHSTLDMICNRQLILD